MTRVLLLFSLLGCAVRTTAQSRASTDFLTDLRRFADAISTASKPDAPNHDKLESANENLQNWLLKEGAAHPDWLSAGSLDFEEDGVHVLTSPDRRFRIYCWDTQTGGTMHFYSGVIQYLAAPGRSVTVDMDDSATIEDGGDPGRWYSAVHTVQTTRGEAFYLPVYHGTYSTRDRATGIQAYVIRSGALRSDVPLFFTKTKSYDHISYSYDLFGGGKGDPGNPPQITLSRDARELRIPVIDEDGVATGGTLLYRFDGNRFQYAPPR